MYKDTVHVHWKDRDDMKNGDIVRVKVFSDNGHCHKGLFAVRGRREMGKIGIDFLGCAHLKVEAGAQYRFTFERTGIWTKLKWARQTADPSARIAMWIAYWSAVVGLIGFVLGVIGAAPVLIDFKHWLFHDENREMHPTKPNPKTNESPVKEGAQAPVSK